MKSLLRFFLLFVLVILGKLAKQPEGLPGMAKAAPVLNSLPVQHTSFFQQLELKHVSPEAGRRLWRATVPASAGSVSAD